MPAETFGSEPVIRDGRSAVIAVTTLPAEPETPTQLNATVETAVCDAG